MLQVCVRCVFINPIIIIYGYLYIVAEERELELSHGQEWSFMPYLISLQGTPSMITAIDASSSIRCTTGRHLVKLAELREHSKAVTALSVSPDQRELLSGDAAGVTIRWTVKDTDG